MLDIDLSPTNTQSTPRKGDYLLRVEDDELLRILDTPTRPIQLMRVKDGLLLDGPCKDMSVIKELMNVGHYILIKQEDLQLVRK